jgi:abortive infection bacteriophage resistance protein
MQKHFDKTPKTPNEHLKLLENRGLVVADKPRLLQYLRRIGYYRLSAYFLPFQIGDHSASHHTFRSDVTFDDVLSLYIFDRKLRLCLFDALERVEVAIRAAITDSMCELTQDSHWHLNSKNFGNRFDNKYSRPFDHDAFMKKIADEDEVFLKHYRNTYNDPKQPPSWMAFQVLSFGTCSFALAHLQKRQAVAVCKTFDLEPIPMISWVQGMCILRNHCAHHSRIWNRYFTHQLSLSGKNIPTLYSPLTSRNHRTIEGYASILDYFMQKINPNSQWQKRLNMLIAEYYKNVGQEFMKEKIERVTGEWRR